MGNIPFPTKKGEVGDQRIISKPGNSRWQESKGMELQNSQEKLFIEWQWPRNTMKWEHSKQFGKPPPLSLSLSFPPLAHVNNFWFPNGVVLKAASIAFSGQDLSLKVFIFKSSLAVDSVNYYTSFQTVISYYNKWDQSLSHNSRWCDLYLCVVDNRPSS